MFIAVLESQEEALSTMYLFEPPKYLSLVSEDEARAINLHHKYVETVYLVRTGRLARGAETCHISENEALLRAKERSINGFFPQASVNWCADHNEIVDYFGVCPQNSVRLRLPEGEGRSHVDRAVKTVYEVIKRLLGMGIEYSNLDLKGLGLVD